VAADAFVSDEPADEVVCRPCDVGAHSGCRRRGCVCACRTAAPSAIASLLDAAIAPARRGRPLPAAARIVDAETREPVIVAPLVEGEVDKDPVRAQLMRLWKQSRGAAS
jgi:hypothetical protein